ncbi:MAG: AraC family transcriptional regulator [bacterium]|nr:AraC family transcriptional regulator [bacterium]
MNPDTKRDYAERMLRVLVHIQQHLDDALDLTELAAVAHFSPYHFHRVFRGMVGESVKEHIRRLRLERAAQRLKTTDQPVTRTAFDAGYETHEAFTRAFRAMFGESPSGFREGRKAILVPSVRSGVHFDPDAKLDGFNPIPPGEPPMDVRIDKLEPRRVAFMRHVGPYHEVGGTWEKLCAWAGPKGLLGPQTLFLGLCHDDPEVTPPDKIRYDACVAASADFQPEGEIGAQEIAGGDYAVATHRGPYENLGETYAQLCGKWVPQSARELRSAPSFEVYRNTPQDTAPEDLITDVHVPLV